jgi:hypothetical protein
MKQKLTPNEKYLLNIICCLRGSAYDAWGRLNSIREGRETVRRAAPKTELKQMLDELAGALHADHTGAFGAHLPHPNDPHLSPELKHALIERHRRATVAGRRVKNVHDLVRKNER